MGVRGDGGERQPQRPEKMNNSYNVFGDNCGKTVGVKSHLRENCGC